MTKIRNSLGPAERGGGEFALVLRGDEVDLDRVDSVLQEAPWALRDLAADSHRSCHPANIVVTTVTKMRKFSVF